MNRGKILKIRLGHEANCSSGMVSGSITTLACMCQMPTAIIIYILEAFTAMHDWSPKWRSLAWIIPQLLGVAFIAFYINFSNFGATEYGFEAISWSAIIGASYALAVSLGYFLVSRRNLPLWLAFITPVTFIVGVIPVTSILSIVLSFLSYYLGPAPGPSLLIGIYP